MSDTKKRKLVTVDPGDGRPIVSVTFRCGCTVRRAGWQADGERALFPCGAHKPVVRAIEYLYDEPGKMMVTAWLDWVWEYGQERVWSDE